MEFHQMRYLLSVYKKRSFTKGADEGGVVRRDVTPGIRKGE